MSVTIISLRSSRFLFFSRRRSNKRAIKRASTWGEQKIREKWGRDSRPSGFSFSQFSSPLRAFGKEKETAATQAIRLWEYEGCYENVNLVAFSPTMLVISI